VSATTPGDPEPAADTSALREPNAYEANRALFEELDHETKAASAAMDADDMDAWNAHAGRAAEIYQQIAERLGWDTTAPRYDEETPDA
jgi:hypothetical protein